MRAYKTIWLYGQAAAKERARLVLENQTQIRRIDTASDVSALNLLFDQPQDEKNLIPLLADCGISGFRLE